MGAGYLTAGLLSLLALGLAGGSEPEPEREPERERLAVALHAQSRYVSHGWVAGSEITTAGMLAALRRHPRVGRAEVFAPFAYEGLADGLVDGGGGTGCWDVLLVEGWTGPVPQVIHTLRRACPDIAVVHWCLDTYPNLTTVQGLDVDAFTTNSQSLVSELSRTAPTLYLALAADPETMRPRRTPRAEYAHPVVYLGQASPTKHRLVPMLTEVAPLGLAIYGMAWDRDERYAPLLPYWKVS